MECVVAMTERGVIGKDGGLPWKVQEDLRRFKDLTTGGVVVMGRKTFESIGRVLPGRRSIILDEKGRLIKGAKVCRSLDELFDLLRQESHKIFVVGGASVYRQLLPYCDLVHMSVINGQHEGDIYFPKLNLKEWHLADRQAYDEFVALTYQRSNHGESIAKI